MQTTLELLEKAPESLIAAGVRSAFVPRNRAVIAADRGCGSVTTVLEPAREPAMDGFCLWCDRTFLPRTTGGSTQKFCCTGHRQQFWIAARRWTMRAIEVGLLSIDCLKAAHTSVHAAAGTFGQGEDALAPDLVQSASRAAGQGREAPTRSSPIARRSGAHAVA
jgi:hypothetical protein